MLTEIDANNREHEPDTSTADGVDSKLLFVVKSQPRKRRKKLLKFKHERSNVRRPRTHEQLIY